ncbi:MAG: hypothetical protein HY739_04075 [Desulfobacterales bacterium]|nr:hypothetical protein [Desulfobacterales bacterium]
MKKFVILTMAVALIAFFAMSKGASAAAPQIIFSGDYQVVGIASNNVSDRDSDLSDGAAYVEQRFRLTHIAAMENVKGVFGIEIGWDEWGKSYTSNGVGTTPNQGGDTGMIADTPSTNIEVRMAYIDFNVPGIPLSVTAGKQFLFTHNHAILAGVAATPGLKFDYKIADGSKLSLWWTKFAEGTVSNNTLRGNGDADDDIYALEFSKKTQAYDFGVYGVYNRDHRETDVAASSTGTTTSNQLYNDDIYWAGLWTGFNAGPVKLGFDAIYSFGKRKYQAVPAGQTDYDFSGYYLRADASMKLGGPTLDFMSLYASGDNDSTDDKIKNFAYADSNARYPALGIILPGPNLLYWGNGIATEEYAQICLPTSGYSAYDSGYSLGRWFTMLGATVPVDNKLKLVAKYWYLRTAEGFPSTITYRDKNMGHEFDLEAHYQLTPNLTVSAEADYLLAGKYFDSSTKTADNAWKAAWAIKLVF